MDDAKNSEKVENTKVLEDNSVKESENATDAHETLANKVRLEAKEHKRNVFYACIAAVFMVLLASFAIFSCLHLEFSNNADPLTQSIASEKAQNAQKSQNAENSGKTEVSAFEVEHKKLEKVFGLKGIRWNPTKHDDTTEEGTVFLPRKEGEDENGAVPTNKDEPYKIVVKYVDGGKKRVITHFVVRHLGLIQSGIASKQIE